MPEKIGCSIKRCWRAYFLARPPGTGVRTLLRRDRIEPTEMVWSGHRGGQIAPWRLFDE